GDEVLCQGSGDLARPCGAALAHGYLCGPVEYRERVGPGSGCWVEGDNLRIAEAQGFVEDLPENVVAEVHLGVHHVDWGVVDAGLFAGGRVVLGQEVLVEPQPGLTTRVIRPCDPCRVDDGGEPFDRADLRCQFIQQAGYVERWP